MDNDKQLTNIPSEPSGLLKASPKMKSAWRVLKATGPLLISLSDKTSQKFADHKMRLAKVDVFRELIIEEGKALIEVQKDLLKKYQQSDQAEKWRIKKELKEIEEELRYLMITEKAMGHIEDLPDGQAGQGKKEYMEVNPHWLDNFFELARKVNEKWREDLLSMALARESIEANTISVKALWYIGTLAEEEFHAFAHLLDLCTMFSGSLIIPIKSLNNLMKTPVPECMVEDNPYYGNLLVIAEECNLMVSENVSREWSKENTVKASYGSESYEIFCTEELSVTGILLTGIGHEIARLYDRKPNKIGREIFNNYISFLKGGNWPIKKIA